MHDTVPKIPQQPTTAIECCKKLFHAIAWKWNVWQNHSKAPDTDIGYQQRDCQRKASTFSASCPSVRISIGNGFSSCSINSAWSPNPTNGYKSLFSIATDRKPRNWFKRQTIQRSHTAYSFFTTPTSVSSDQKSENQGTLLQTCTRLRREARISGGMLGDENAFTKLRTSCSWWLELSCDQQLTNPAANNSRATYGFFSPQQPTLVFSDWVVGLWSKKRHTLKERVSLMLFGSRNHLCNI